MPKKYLSKSQIRVWLIVFLLATLFFLVNYMRFVTKELAEGKPGKYLHR